MTAKHRRATPAPPNPHEWYRTPPEAVRAILPHLGRPQTVLDLGCGDGAIGSVLRQEWGAMATIDGCEIDEGRADQAAEARAEVDDAHPFCGGRGVVPVYDDIHPIDALGDGVPSPYDLVISNPPFSLAEAFARRAFDLVRPGGMVVFLVRLGWLASRKRAAFHRQHPSDVFVLPERPSFTSDGKTDAADYCFVRWGLGYGGRWQVLEVQP